MEIKRYENEQYAGMHGQSFRFESGMNVVLGNNETGKSTMISGIYDTLLQSSKIDQRKDKPFLNSRFPTSGSSVIDGSVNLECNGNEVAVRKEWSKEPKNSRTRVTINGELEVGDTAEAHLKKELTFGGAIYDNIIFGRQNNEAEILEWLYQFMDMGNKKQTDAVIGEARDKISGAISAAGGINEDKFVEKLTKIIADYSSNWDCSRNCPVGNRGINNPWKTNIGTILKSYYQYERAKNELNQSLQQLSDNQKKEQKLLELKSERNQQQSKQDSLNQQKGSVEKGDRLQSELRNMKAELEHDQDIIRAWPVALQEQKTLKSLQEEQNEQHNREEKSRLEAILERANMLQAQINELREKTKGLDELPADTAEGKTLAKTVQQAELQLGSAKLRTSIRLLSGTALEMTSASGEQIKVTQDMQTDVNGYAKITIPGIAEIVVAPQELNVEELQKTLVENRQKLDRIFETYQVNNLEGLEEKCNLYRENDKERKSLEKNLTEISIDRVQEETASISTRPEMSIRPNLQEEIAEYLSKCGAKSLEGRGGALEQELKEYEKYGSVEALSEKCEKLQAEAVLKQAEIDALPQNLMSAEALKMEEKACSESIAQLNESIEKTSKSIVNCDDIDLEGLEKAVEGSKKTYENNKRQLELYQRIKKDFEATQTKESKYDSFFEKFNEYLDLVTGGVLKAEEGENLRTHGMPMPEHELLSRGTKQTILLAFRLALLNFYFPEEGGMVVLDDVLLDMDPTRRENAVLLLQTFAEKHQVIFTTCDPAIAAMLGGNLIQL